MLPTWAHHRAVVLSTSITRLPHLLFGQSARRVSAQVVRQSLSEWYGRVQVLARPSCSLPVRPLTHRQVMRSSFSSSRRPAPQPRPSGSIETLRLLGHTDHLCASRLESRVTSSAITRLPFGEEAWRHIPCAIVNFLGSPRDRVMYCTCKSLHRWMYSDFDTELLLELIAGTHRA